MIVGLPVGATPCGCPWCAIVARGGQAQGPAPTGCPGAPFHGRGRAGTGACPYGLPCCAIVAGGGQARGPAPTGCPAAELPTCVGGRVLNPPPTGVPLPSRRVLGSTKSRSPTTKSPAWPWPSTAIWLRRWNSRPPPCAPQSSSTRPRWKRSVSKAKRYAS